MIDADDLPELPEFFDDAACAGLPTDWWFPSERFVTPHRALKVCRRCPIRGRCLNYALEHRIADGVWGGASETERRQLRRQRRGAA